MNLFHLHFHLYCFGIIDEVNDGVYFTRSIYYNKTKGAKDMYIYLYFLVMRIIISVCSFIILFLSTPITSQNPTLYLSLILDWEQHDQIIYAIIQVS